MALRGKKTKGKKSKFFGQMFLLTRSLSLSFSHICRQGFIAGSCVPFQHVGKPVSTLQTSGWQVSPPFTKAGLFLAFKWEAKPWSLLKTLLKKRWVIKEVQCHTRAHKRMWASEKEVMINTFKPLVPGELEIKSWNLRLWGDHVSPSQNGMGSPPSNLINTSQIQHWPKATS